MTFFLRILRTVVSTHMEADDLDNFYDDIGAASNCAPDLDCLNI